MLISPSATNPAGPCGDSHSVDEGRVLRRRQPDDGATMNAPYSSEFGTRELEWRPTFGCRHQQVLPIARVRKFFGRNGLAPAIVLPPNRANAGCWLDLNDELDRALAEAA